MIPRLVLIAAFLWIGLALGAELPSHVTNTNLQVTNTDLPNPAKTPGLADPAMTAEVLCAKKFTTRDTRNVTSAMKRKVYARYNAQNHKGQFANCPAGAEVDHLISLEIGGANDIKNLWPQNYCGTWGARVKDKLENRLHKLVCAGEVDLETAQREISTDWIASYKARMQ